MHIAINFFSGILIFLGLGFSTSGYFLFKTKPGKISNILPLLFASGILLNYTIVLIVQTLKTAILISTILSLPGNAVFIYYIFKFRSHFFNFKRINFMPLFLFLSIYIVYVLTILANPLTDWDARSIWYFHGKIIFSYGAFSKEAGFTETAVKWAQIDYPKLNAVLSAQFAYYTGYWNEYMPKISLAYLLLPVLLWIFTFFKFNLSFILLLVIFPFSILINTIVRWCLKTFLKSPRGEV